MLKELWLKTDLQIHLENIYSHSLWAHRLCRSSCHHMRSAAANCFILNLARSDSKHCVSIRQSPCKYHLFCFHTLKFPAQNLMHARNTSQLQEGLLLACWLEENTVLQQLGRYQALLLPALVATGPCRCWQSSRFTQVNISPAISPKVKRQGHRLSLTYVLSIHVIVEAKTIGRVRSSIRIFWSDTENRTNKSGLFSFQPGARRLNVHVET